MVSISSQYSVRPLTSSHIWTRLEDLCISAPDELINCKFHRGEARKYQSRHHGFPPEGSLELEGQSDLLDSVAILCSIII